MATPEDYRSAAIFARVVGSDAGSFTSGVNRPAVVQATGLGKTTVFTHKVTSHLASTHVVRVVRINGTWRVAGCFGCVLTDDPCAWCAAVFVGINPGITFPSKHSDDEWNLAHRVNRTLILWSGSDKTFQQLADILVQNLT